MDKLVYTCAGSCKAEIAEEEYNKGLTKCGAQGCNHFGQAFEKKKKCQICGVYYKEEETHTHR